MSIEMSRLVGRNLWARSAVSTSVPRLPPIRLRRSRPAWTGRRSGVPRPAAHRRAAMRLQSQLRRTGSHPDQPDDEACRTATWAEGDGGYSYLIPREGYGRGTTAAGCMRWATVFGTPTPRSGHRCRLFAAVGARGAGHRRQYRVRRHAGSIRHCSTIGTKAEIEGLITEHSIAFSRSQLGFQDYGEGNDDKIRPVRHRLVRTHPVTGRSSLYLSAHIGGIVGWPVPEARAFIRDLTEHVDASRIDPCAPWRVNDLVMWDNRTTMHRARRYRDLQEVRDLRRTSIKGTGPTVEQFASIAAE